MTDMRKALEKIRSLFTVWHGVPGLPGNCRASEIYEIADAALAAPSVPVAITDAMNRAGNCACMEHCTNSKGVNEVYKAMHAASPPALDVEEIRSLLAPFAKDADNWADSVPDDYHPLCTEPRRLTADPGSTAAFNVGDLRRVRAAIAKIEAMTTREFSNGR